MTCFPHTGDILRKRRFPGSMKLADSIPGLLQPLSRPVDSAPGAGIAAVGFLRNPLV